MIATAVPVVQEQAIPFSGGREAAEIIRQKAPPGVPIIGDCDYCLGNIAGHLNCPVYIAWRGEFGTPVTFNPADPKRIPGGRGMVPMRPDELAKVLQDFLAMEKRDVVLVVNYPLSVSPDSNIRLLGVANRSLTGDEQYMVFLVKYLGP